MSSVEQRVQAFFSSLERALGGPHEQSDAVQAELRAALRRLGVERAPGVSDPEDHAAFACDDMAGLLDGRFPGGPDAAADFFARHLRPWAARFFADLEKAEAARFYRAVGTLGRVAVEIEGAAADLPA